MNSKIELILIIVFLNYSCRDSKERNNINFNDDKIVVQSWIEETMLYLEKLPDPSPGYLKNYYFKFNNELYINSTKVGTIKDDDFNSIQSLNVFTVEEKKHWFSLINKLKSNFISGAYQSSKDKHWYFTYRERVSESFDQGRDILFIQGLSDTISLASEHKILDIKENLVLVKPLK
jgi:hypothetical protein